MADTEDMWLAAGAGISVAVFGVCVLAQMVRRCYAPSPPRMDPVILLKPSRSDNDLENMLSEVIPAASIRTPPSEDPREYN